MDVRDDGDHVVDRPGGEPDPADDAGGRTQRRSLGGFFGRTTGERLGVIATVLALLVAIGAWLLPQPHAALCALTGNRFPACNDIPPELPGTWRGTLTMNSDLGSDPGSGIDTLEIRRARIGDVAAEQRPENWYDEQGRNVGCARTWRLAAVRDDGIELRSTQAWPVDPQAPDDTEICQPVLTLDVQTGGPDAIRVSAQISGEGLPTAIPLYDGTLRRVPAES